MRDRRVGWPELLVLLGFLALSSFIAYRTHRAFVEPAERPSAASIEEPEGAETWVHHPWVEDGGAPGSPVPPTTEAPLAPPAHDDLYDPQRWAMRRAYPSDGDAGAPLPFEPIERSARVVSLTGSLPFGRRARCDVRVLPANAGALDCLVRVRCDAHIVYPNPTQTAGYVACELDADGRVLRAVDAGHTALDGDPRLRLDLGTAEVVVSDAGDGVSPFEVTLRLN